MAEAFVRTDTVLDRILGHKQEEVIAVQGRLPLARLRDEMAVRLPARDFLAALRRDTVALIAECKRASPSAGLLLADYDPAHIVGEYARGGAAAVSVLCDARFFQGDFAHLEAAQAAVDLPLLCKEFVIDPWQIWRARAAGADAVLLIVAALADAQLSDLYGQIRGLGMTPLVEVHDETELARALALRPALVGVNNRDLRTFHVDLATTESLASLLPADVTLVAESGIHSAGDVQRMGQAGARAVLVGEALMRADDIAARVREFSRCERK